jgi:hypothetical protein
VAKLGTSFESAVVYRTMLSAGHYDGADTVRPFAYVDGCQCFRYTSATYQIPD